MNRRFMLGVFAIAEALCSVSSGARAETPDDVPAGAALNVKPAVLTSNGEASAPITEVQYRRYYRRGWGSGYPYRAWSGYYPGYRNYPRDSYGYYPRNYSYNRPYYRGYSYPRYYTGYRGFRYSSPWVSGAYFW